MHCTYPGLCWAWKGRWWLGWDVYTVIARKGFALVEIDYLDEETEGLRDYNSVATDCFFQKEVCERLCGIDLSEDTY